MTITLSIVSHGQAGHVEALLRDLDRACSGPLEIEVTLNIPEPHALQSACRRLPLRIVANDAPRGFGANHNAAFARATGEHFCVLNPDVRIDADPFPELLACLADERVGVCAPLVRDPAGRVEDSARDFPTPLSIAAKALGLGEGRTAYAADARFVHPDWVAGIFMLFRAGIFREIGGFDERYRLYYEDVDLCARLRLAGREVALCPRASVVHDARRKSHRDLRYLAWHLASMARFFTSAPCREIERRRAATRA